MELLSAEAKRLTSMVNEWWTHTNQELEATFGFGGTVSLSDFIRITQRLRSKGLEFMPQEDKLNIITPEKIRYTLDGFGVIQQYCRDNMLVGKGFTAMIKDQTAIENTIDLESYNVRVKVRRELPLATDSGQVQDMLSHWDVQKKAFRLIRRWSFKGQGFRIDLSMVRQTSRDSRGKYRFVNTFLENPVTKVSPVYEIEVELIRDELKSAEDAQKTLIKMIGEVLRGIQNNVLLIRNSHRNRVLESYKILAKTTEFRGVQPVTLEIINMNSDIASGVPNIRNGYNVTDKADGLRALGFCDSTGELFLIDMNMRIYRTGLASKACANSLVDGEWITRDKLNKPMQQFALFDIYNITGGESVAGQPFYSSEGTGRWKMMQDWLSKWNGGVKPLVSGLTPKTTINIVGKDFVFANAGDNSIFKAASKVFDTPKPYHTDGLIFTPNSDLLPSAGKAFKSQFKWKPALDNSIDFLVLFEKDPMLVNEDKIINAVKPDTGATVAHKSMRLYVSSHVDPILNDPRGTILYEQPLQKKDDKRTYRPALFNPKEHPDLMASYSYGEIEYDIQSNEEYVVTDNTKEPILDRSIVEFRYDPKRAPGWRWIPMRIRHDKTERFMRGIMRRTMNGETTAESVWNSIHNPVTQTMIRTGSETPSEEELSEFYSKRKEEEGIERKYYDRKASDIEMAFVKGLREFHNWHIKENILFKTILYGGNKKLIDVAYGRGGDLMKVKRNRAAFLLGIDIAGENITNKDDGAYRRYLDGIKKFGRDKMPVGVFVIGDSSKKLITGDAAAEGQDRDILRSVFGYYEPDGALPKYVENNVAGALKGGADAIVCMFALHYFFEREKALDGLIANIRDTLKVGGYFAGACFDGDRVHSYLSELGVGGTRVGAEGDNILWTITKQYENDNYVEQEYGCAIDVDFITIGMTHREYLVPFGLLVRKMSEIGCELLNDTEAKQVHLGKSTEIFEETHQKVKNKFPMPDSIKQFSFLNRWFVFVRRTDAKTAEETLVVKNTVDALKENKNMIDKTVAMDMADGTAIAAAKTEKGIAIDKSLGPIVTLKNDVAPKTLGSMEEASQMEAISEAALATTSTIPAISEKLSERIPTVPVAVPDEKKRYSPNEIFIFYADAATSTDKLKSGYKDGGRWLAPYAPFIIMDGTTEYPTMEHYIAAMKYKLASNSPEMARGLFARDGQIHNDLLQQRLTKAGGRPLSVDMDQEFLKKENDMVKLRSGQGAMNKVGFNVIKWAIVKDKVIEEAIQQRMTRDAKFKKIVDAAKAQGVYLLYYTGSSGGSELGGVRRPDGRIDGDNRIGKTIMRLAGYSA
jgi:SAM-dependent methyltransferase